MRPRIAVKHAFIFTLLLAVLVTGASVTAGLLAFNEAHVLKNQLREVLRADQLLNQEQALLRNSAYLSNRLFNPLYNLDVAVLNEEIAQIKTWLPIQAFLIMDKKSQVLTDGSEENALYGKPMALPPELSSDAPIILRTADNIAIAFVIGYADEVAGFAKVTLSDNALRQSLTGLEQDVDKYWSNFSQSLLYIAVLTVVAILLLGALLGWRLSRSLAHPLAVMNEAARQFAQGNLSYQLPTAMAGEFGELAASLSQMAHNLHRSSKVLAKAQEIAGVGSWEWFADSNRLLWSDYVYRLFGADRKTLEPNLPNLIQYVKPADRDRVVSLFQRSTLSSAFESEFTLQRTDGSERVLHLRGEPVLDGHGTIIGALGTLQDVTERRQAEEKLAYLANYDTLTYLPNRYLFQDRLQHAMQRADRENTQVALLFLDLDHFKSVNDALGHDAGDELLKLAAARLVGAVRVSDTVARLGGDEFTIILEQVTHISSVAAVAEKVIDRLTSSFTLGTREIFISASIGVTFYPTDARDSNTLLKNADTAMYRAKEQGRNSYFFFTAELNQHTHERLALENSLRSAFARNEFLLYFQPQIYLESGKLVGVEVLLRWRSQDQWTSPSQFIPVLEDTGLIIPVGEWVLEQACARIHEWQQYGLRELRVSVNFSARQIHQREFLASLKAALDKTQLPAEFFEIEITESTLLDTAASTEVLNRLQDIGVRLAIDDFGTGYSSLTYLKRFSVDTLKIDSSFIRDIVIDADDAAITSAIIGLSHSLGIEVIAEGVETVEQIEFLRQHGCKLIQGYYVSSPLPPDEFLRWVKERCIEEEGYHYWQDTAAQPQPELDHDRERSR